MRIQGYTEIYRVILKNTKAYNLIQELQLDWNTMAVH